MFSGSDEWVLREIADGSHKIVDVLIKNMIEVEFANSLKLYELGKIDENEFNRQYENYEYKREQIDNVVYKR